MNLVRINGVIGLDVTKDSIQSVLDHSSGDVLFNIDSPGGLISEGIAIFNEIREYNRGKTTCIVTRAYSMASLLMLAADKLKFHSNASVMVHNPIGYVSGNVYDLQQYVKYFNDLTEMIRQEYVKYGPFDYPTMKKYLDNETFFLGEQDLGLWGEVLKADKNKININPVITKEQALANISQMYKNFDENLLAKDFEKLSQMLPIMLKNKEQDVIANLNKPDNNVSLVKQEEKMDLKELKEKHPDVYAQACNEGYEKGKKDGAACELKRVQAHMQFFKLAPTEVMEAINTNKEFIDVLPKYTSLAVSAQKIAKMEKESPESLNDADADLLDGNLKQQNDSATAQKQQEMAFAEALKANLASMGLNL